MQDDSLWDFAVALYGREGVSAACLELQDEAGVDVPLLLFAAWLGARAVSLSDPDLARLDRGITPWRTEVVQVLRKLRRDLKSGPAPAPGGTEEFRERIKGVELAAERIELAWLEEQAENLAPASPRPGGLVEENLRAVVRHAAGGPTGARTERALSAILQALDSAS